MPPSSPKPKFGISGAWVRGGGGGGGGRGELIPSSKAVGLECVPPIFHSFLLGVNEKVQLTGEPMPIFFLGVGLIVLFFSAFIF